MASSLGLGPGALWGTGNRRPSCGGPCPPDQDQRLRALAADFLALGRVLPALEAFPFRIGAARRGALDLDLEAFPRAGADALARLGEVALDDFLAFPRAFGAALSPSLPATVSARLSQSFFRPVRPSAWPSAISGLMLRSF